MFIFQPAEESAPEGEEGGAELMLKEGLFAKTKPDAVFGLHVFGNAVSRFRRLPRGSGAGCAGQVHDQGEGTPDARVAGPGAVSIQSS